MQVSAYIQEPVSSLLDVGCNAGVWLRDCARRYPGARLAGVEINEPAIEKARQLVPTAELHRTGAEKIPFPDRTFQYVTCVEVLEHLPAELRGQAFQEMRRVLQPGGRLIMTVPHRGWFDWLDSNNVRYRLPGLYRFFLRGGGRDASYAKMGRQVEWHQHFTQDELLKLAGAGWKLIAVRHGGLFIYPVMDWLSWPFYRLGRPHNPLRQLFERIAGWDYSLDFGRASYGILIVLERSET
jgi:SAM-dependent methyltransferase